MVDNVKDIPETADNKATLDALDRARLARERREAEQRKRLDELHAQAAAAQAQRERRDDERRRRQQEQRARDDERRHQVEERKRAIWEASVSRREALLQRDRERTERLERARATRSSPRSAFAFGSSTPRLLEPVDSAGFFWAARSTNPIDQINFFESFKPEAASTTNVMMASAPLSMHSSSALFTSDNKDKDENERSPQPAAWSSVARRRTDLVPTLPASRAPEWRSGETTPGSRPSSALSNAAGVVRRGTPARRPRPVSIAGTGVNTPRGGTECGLSLPSTPSVSRDSTVVVVVAATPPSGEVPRRAQPTQRRPRPLSAHGAVKNVVAPPANPADGKPPLQRKPKPSKEVDKNASANKSPVSAIEVTQKLVALQVRNGDEQPVGNQNVDKENETKPIVEAPTEVKLEQKAVDDKPAEPQKPEPKPADAQKPVEKVEVKEEKREQSQEKIEEVDMTGSMTGRRITTEEEAKAALAERRRKAREELEKQAELERQRLLREAQEEEERQRLEEERQRREEVEARELARLQRAMEEEKLRKAIEAQQQLEREEAERKAREEVERQARLREDEGKRKAAEEAERLRREEAEKEEKERLARKQRVEAIMARTRLRKAEEDKTQQEGKAQPAPAAPAAHPDNGNAVTTGDLLGFGTSQPDESSAPKEAVANNAAPAEPKPTPNNGNVTADLLGMSDENNTEDKTKEQSTVASKQIDNSAVAAPAPETNNGNVHLPEPTVGHISANFIQTERSASEHSQKLPETMSKLIEDDFTAHNGHGANHDKPLTLTMQN